MPTQFNEQFFAEQSLDPLAPVTIHEFPWEELFERLGEPAQEVDDLDAVIRAMTALFVWAIGNDHGPDSLKLIGERAIATATAFGRGDLIDGTLVAPERLQSRLAELDELGFPIISEITPQSIAT